MTMLSSRQQVFEVSWVPRRRPFPRRRLQSTVYRVGRRLMALAGVAV